MPISRRGVVKLIGGGSVAALAIGGGLYGCDRMPASAVTAWTGPAPEERDPRRRLLGWALLAPNPHNRQSWLADLRRTHEITLYVDRARLLPETDPLGRQIVIGCGCFLELLALAAAAEGVAVDIDQFPEGEYPTAAIDQRPFARIRLHEGAPLKADPLFRQVPHRRTTRENYEDRPLTREAAAALVALAMPQGVAFTLDVEEARVARLRDIATRAMRIEMETPRTLKESIDLTRIGASAIAADPDGISLHGPLFWWLRQLGLLTTEKALTPGTVAFETGLDVTLGWARTGAAYGRLTTHGNGRAAQLASGRAYLRLALKVAELGLAMQPMSQVLQEYPEMAALQKEFLALIGTPPSHTVQMLFRLGYAAPAEPSPRRPLEQMLIT